MTSESWVAECDEQNRWKGLRLFAVDGSSLRIADTPAQRGSLRPTGIESRTSRLPRKHEWSGC
jgi:hypothetical protein